MSDIAAFRVTFRIEASHNKHIRSSFILVASLAVEKASNKLLNIFAQSSIFDAWLCSYQRKNNTNWIQHNLFMKSFHGQEYKLLLSGT